MKDIDDEFRVLDVRRPADEDIDYDFIEQMELGNRDLKQKLGAMVITVKDAVDRAQQLKNDRNKFTSLHSHDNKEVESKEKELMKYNLQIKK